MAVTPPKAPAVSRPSASASGTSTIVGGGVGRRNLRILLWVTGSRQELSVVGSRFSTHEQHQTDSSSTTWRISAAARRCSRPRPSVVKADRSEARLLALAIQAVLLHPVDERHQVAAWGDPPLTVPDEETRSPTTSPARHPGVAERAVEELAAALDVSYRSACGLVAAALELRYRLPRLWALVRAGRLQAWKARKVAELHHPPLPRGRGLRRRPGRHAGARNRLAAAPDRADPPGARPVRPRDRQQREQAAQRPREVPSLTTTRRPTPSPAPPPSTPPSTARRPRPRHRRLRGRERARPPRRRVTPGRAPRPRPRRCSPTPKGPRPVRAVPPTPRRARRNRPASHPAGLATPAPPALRSHLHRDLADLPPATLRGRRAPRPAPREARYRHPRPPPRPGSTASATSPLNPSST